MIWAFFSPIAALVLDRGPKSIYWLGAFVALTIFSAIIDPWLIQHQTALLPEFAIELFFVLNISVTLSGVYFLFHYFTTQREKDAQDTIGDNISYLQSYKDTIDRNLIVTRTDIEGKITFANENFYRVSGFKPEEVLGYTHQIIRHPENSHALFKKMWDTILSKQTWQGRIQNKNKKGETYWVETTIAPILNNNNEIVEFLAIRNDISQLLQQQEELTKLLYFDHLTNIHNRNALYKDLKQTRELSLLLINIDSFSQLNDLYGEKMGDKILKQFSTFLLSYVLENENISLYRLGGDEFVLLLNNQKPLSVVNIAKDLVSNVNKAPLSIDELVISLSITIGVSLEENLLLLSTANMALKIARRSKKNIVVFSNEISLNDEYEKNMKWIKEIKDAIKHDRIIIYYQPIVNNEDNTITKYETLVRLIDKQGNVISPVHFLEIAKKAKLYKELTKIIIRKSFKAFEHNTYDFSVNITIEDILDPEIRSFIVDTLQEYDISKMVVFEIVESESIENFEEIENFIIEVKSYGCKIAIDDFGTGYSNFEHLMRLQADFIKIDGSIIREIVYNKRSELITSVIVAFAKKMGIKTIGEYVESKEINDKLIDLGVNKSQGYYFDKPQATLAKKGV
jgi:diguanylate cyclase (GGDEF)-like protein/PAS domain S-box-containing protein